MSDIKQIPQTPEAVAFQLMENILESEGKGPSANLATRKEILQTFQECLLAVKEPQPESETNLSEAA